MFDFIIKNEIKKFLQPIVESGTRLKMTMLKGEKVIVITNFPTNYRADYAESLGQLEGFGVELSTGKYNGEACLILKKLQKEYIHIIESVINKY